MYTKHKKSRDKASLVTYLQQAGIRATRQRLDLASLLFDGTHKHMTAEQVHNRLTKKQVKISLATVYNSLHQFTDAGLLREVSVDPTCLYFDTNMGKHYHFYDEVTGDLTDIDDKQLRVSHLPVPPAHREIDRIDLILRLRKA